MVERHFVTINGRWAQRQVHYRRCGTGPVVLLLHQSPKSSLEYEQHMLAWAEDFTVIAPDHPGYGLSDPLGADDVSLEDFADALAEFLQAIGVQSAAVYGFHTGAGMAVALAAQHPEKVSAVYANGYIVLSNAERDHILSEYLPPFIPQWDGSHLSYAWSRIRDQLTYFPWFDRRLSARLEYTLPTPAALQEWLLDFLRAGDNYRVAYRAAFCFPGDKPLKSLQVPAIITATSTDVILEHLDKITEISESVTVKHGGSMAELLAEARAYFAQHPGSQVPNPPREALLTNRLTSRTIEYDHGQLRIRHSNNGSGMPILLIHGAGRSSQNILSLANAFVTKRPVVTLDLPGHGESDSWPADVSFVEAAMQAINAVLNELGIESVDAWGEWAGGSLLCEFALRSPERVEHLALTGAQLYSTEEAADLIENYAPEIVPVWHGGHLQEYWHRVRSESLFWPWYAQTTDNIIRAEPRLDTVDVHERVLALLQSAGDQHRVHAEMFAYPLANSLADCSVPVLIGAASWDPNREHSVTAAATNSKHSFVELADEPSNWCAELLNFFAGAKSNG